MRNIHVRIICLRKHDHLEWSGEQSCGLLMSSLIDELKSTKAIKYSYLDLEQFETNMTRMQEEMLKWETSIIITCADPEHIRTLVLAASRIGMLETGQFVFFNLDLFGIDHINNYAPWIGKNVSIFLIQIK